MGTVMVAGLLAQGVDRYIWLAFTLACAVWLARRATSLVFAHGALVGFVAGASATFVQGIFAERLAANNPWIVERFSDMPEGFDLQFFVLRLVPFIGVGSAFLTGMFALIASKVITLKRTSS